MVDVKKPHKFFFGKFHRRNFDARRIFYEKLIFGFLENPGVDYSKLQFLQVKTVCLGKFCVRFERISDSQISMYLHLSLRMSLIFSRG